MKYECPKNKSHIEFYQRYKVSQLTFMDSNGAVIDITKKQESYGNVYCQLCGALVEEVED